MLRNGNIAEAVQYYEAAVQQNPQDANVINFIIKLTNLKSRL